jgi:hypothetical protein
MEEEYIYPMESSNLKIPHPTIQEGILDIFPSQQHPE